MKKIIRERITPANILLAALINALSAVPVAADVDSSTANFQSCVGAKIAEEKSKESPSVDSLISACQRQYDAVIADLPGFNPVHR